MRKVKKTIDVYCARCGNSINLKTYIKNLTYSVILNKHSLLSFCDDCVEKLDEKSDETR